MLDWIGSFAKEPKNFKLCYSPEVVGMPSDPVADCPLFMQVTEKSILLLEDEDVTFKGYDMEQRYVATSMLICQENIFTKEIFIGKLEHVPHSQDQNAKVPFVLFVTVLLYSVALINCFQNK